MLNDKDKNCLIADSTIQNKDTRITKQNELIENFNK